jgi:hypothetical protein
MLNLCMNLYGISFQCNVKNQESTI